ncbi:MAG: hypothetical protein IT337_11275 [Thermomicrobiales bacterium]|nr:hypothetical protein [Thermomicrobiales bacterium]
MVSLDAQSPSRSLRDWLTPQLLLVVSGLVVAVAVATADSEVGRVLNGLGGLLWIVAAVWMAASLRGEPRALPIGVVAAAAALILAGIIRPGTFLTAIPAFLIAGALVAMVAGPGKGYWALLAPALYFPIHIVIAIGRVIAAHGARPIRTAPPPTDALVPLSMILAAGVAGMVVAKLLDNRDVDRR